MMKKFVYSPSYDLNLGGLELLHPFDHDKYSKAWALMQDKIAGLDAMCIDPKVGVTDHELSLVHDEAYLQKLKTSREIAKVIHMGFIGYVPSQFLIRRLLGPLRLATKGTMMAAEAALASNSVVMNVGGGFHHAFSDHGEGSCFFADAALAIHHVKEKRLLKEKDAILMVDLDAHRGNGFSSFSTDDSIHLLDLYNAHIYPGGQASGLGESPFNVPLRDGLLGEEYLAILKEKLPLFIDSVHRPALAFYNAGSDVLTGDKLGRLKVDYGDVVRRDQFVIDTLVNLGVPVVVMTSGGYAKDSYRLVAELGNIVARSV